MWDNDTAQTDYDSVEYQKWAAEHSEQIVTEAYLDWVETLCEGHESLRGDMMGQETYCDGTCRPADERSRDAWVEHQLEGVEV